MGVANEYVLHGLNCPGGTFFSQITSGRLNTNLQILVMRGAGNISPQFAGEVFVAPTVTFTTTQIKDLLTLTGNGCSAALTGNIDLYFRRMAPEGDRDALAATTGIRFRAVIGMMHWTSIRAKQNQFAEAEVTVTLVSDGTNAIMVPTGSLAVVGTPSAAQRFTMGPVKVNGSMLGSLDEWSIDSGAKLRVSGSDGDGYPTFAALEEWNPVLTPKSYNHAVWTTFGLDVTALTGFSAFLRGLATNGPPVPLATATHLSIGAGGLGTISLEEVSGGGNGESMTGLKITPVDATGTGSPLLVNTATAIA